MNLTERDLNLLGALNDKIRMLTLSQIAAGWWTATETGRKNAAKRVALLVRAGLLQFADMLARPLLALESPAYEWRPTTPAPHFGALSWRLRSRWTTGPQRTRVYCSSPRGVALLGGAALGKVKNLCQVTHDLHVGQVLLVYRRRWPQEAVAWKGEEALAPQRRHEMLPDAMLLDQFGVPYRVVEFGGGYSARRLRAIHDDCLGRLLPYEIW